MSHARSVRLTRNLDEQAADQFVAAANAFRMQKQGTDDLATLEYPNSTNGCRLDLFHTRVLLPEAVHVLTTKPGKEAGQAFERAASIQLNQLNELDEYANTMTEAFSESNIQ